MKVSEFSTDPNQNQASPPGNAPTGMNPGMVDDVIRYVMAAMAEIAQEAPWIEKKDGTKSGTYAYVSSSSFKIIGTPCANLYPVDTGLKIVISSNPTPTIVNATVQSAVDSAGETLITLANASGGLVNGPMVVFIDTNRFTLKRLADFNNFPNELNGKAAAGHQHPFDVSGQEGQTYSFLFGQNINALVINGTNGVSTSMNGGTMTIDGPIIFGAGPPAGGVAPAGKLYIQTS